MYTISAFCQIMGRPQVLTGIFRELLTRHFASSAQIEEPDLRNLVWSEEERTNILIETAYRWRPDLTQKRPAVIIKRNAYRNMRQGIADARQMPFIDQVGDRYFETLWFGSHTLFCIANSGAQADLLAGEVQRELTEFADVIRRTLDLKRFQPLELGAGGLLEEAQENFVVPVTVSVAYGESWAVRQQAPRLNSISLSCLIE